MFYRISLSIIVLLFLSNCTTGTLIKNKPNISNGYSNKGFALVYSEELYKKKIITKKINERSLTIFQKNLKTNTHVKITNILNNKTIIGLVGKKSKYPSFNNSVLSIRIADELDLDINQPYVEISEIIENSAFVAKKAKTFDEEKKVAVKAPVDSISINDLNNIKSNIKKTSNIKFSYIIKIADFYFNDTALMMLKRIKSDTLIQNLKIKKTADKKYRVYLGPFSNINSLQKSYNDISILEFENIEIIKK
jgi:hypothetical protein|tara:strand:+ start:1145 stop:1894 length:750 start_codon:yes stop_codon:yes gene_type:complete